MPRLANNTVPRWCARDTGDIGGTSGDRKRSLTVSSSPPMRKGEAQEECSARKACRKSMPIMGNMTFIGVPSDKRKPNIIRDRVRYGLLLPELPSRTTQR